VIFNLCSNALKFTNHGSITLKSKALCTEESKRLVIQVIDTGIGISQESMNKLFTAFGMIESSRNVNKSGTGLGLYLSK